MSKLTTEDLYRFLISNSENMVIYDKMSSDIKEGIRDMWDPMVSSGKLQKYTIEGWRGCKDRGPQRHMVYCLTDMPVHIADADKDPKDIYINGEGILANIKSLEKKVDEIGSDVESLATAVSHIIRTTTYCDCASLENFQKVLDAVRQGIVIHN